MKQISIEEIKAIQLDILSAFDAFCKENDITYSLADGTFLGAVRHNGYIPWDDDIDVFMLREEYQKFVSLFPSEFQGHYKLASLETDSRWTKAFPNMYDNRTLLKEDAKGEDIGINIDIFPLDDVPDFAEEQLTYFKKLKVLSSLYVIKALKWRSERSILKNIFIVVAQTLLFFIPLRKVAKRLNDYSQIDNGKGYTNVFECCFGISGQKPFPKELFNELSEYDFEGRKFMGLKDYDTFLKHAYGDYMKLPPEDKRVAHHSFSAFWK